MVAPNLLDGQGRKKRFGSQRGNVPFVTHTSTDGGGHDRGRTSGGVGGGGAKAMFGEQERAGMLLAHRPS